MPSFTYKDIIDEKIAEWQDSLKKLEQQIEKGSSDSQSKFSVKIKNLQSEMDSAVMQLHALDARETVDNTMATKDNILKIFGTIDKRFTEFENKTPFML